MDKKSSKGIKRNKLYVIIAVILILFIIVSSIILINRCINNSNTFIRKELNDVSIYDDLSKIDESKLNVKGKSAKIIKLEELQKENSDIVALIEIEGTNINYPVLQCDNNEYYMTHDYKKKYSKDGSLFLDKDYNWTLPSTNLLIYGHNNIGSNEMFSDLIKYKKENFYNEHKIIKFTTNTEDAEYEIISVFLSRVYYKSETGVFRYYYFIDANDKQEFNDFISNCKKASIYDIDATAYYGDQLLTLSTCEYSQEDGRLAVVARKISK